MLRKLSLGFAVASALLLGFIAATFAQQGTTFAPLSPFLVDIQQTIPVSFTFAMPAANGNVQTVTVPAQVDVYLMVQVSADGSVSPTMQIGRGSTPTVAVEQQVVASPATPTPTSGSRGDGLAAFYGSLPVPMIIDNFSVHLTDVYLWDYQELYERDIAHRRFYEVSAFTDAKVFGAMNMVITNNSDQNLFLSASDAVLLIGSEQVDLVDYMWLSDDLFGDALRPGVVRKGVFVFALKDTAFEDIANNPGIRFEASAPINNDTYAFNRDMKFDIWVPLAPHTAEVLLPGQ